MEKKNFVYAITYRPDIDKFLNQRGVKHFISDADVVVITLDGHNDDPFLELIIDYWRWKGMRDLELAAWLRDRDSRVDKAPLPTPQGRAIDPFCGEGLDKPQEDIDK